MKLASFKIRSVPGPDFNYSREGYGAPYFTFTLWRALSFVLGARKHVSKFTRPARPWV